MNMKESFLKKCYSSLGRVLSTQKTKHILFYSAHLYVLVLLAIMFLMCFSAHFSPDEGFSLELIQHNYIDIVSLTARDVHPPLYYFILKFTSSLIIYLSGGYIGLVPAAKFVSLIPIIILCFICFTYVKKEYGKSAATLSSLWLCLAPSFFIYALEIRMYSWALLFVSIGFLASLRLMRGDGKTSEWIVFTACSVGAAYTHYFAGVAAGIYFVWLFCFKFLTHQTYRKTIIAAVVAALLYLPWFIVFLQQLSEVKSDYWIPTPTVYTLIEYAYFLFGDFNNKVVLVHFLLVSYLLYAIAARYFRSKNKDYCMILGSIIPFLLITIGVALSFLIRPIFMVRYAFPTLFCFWMAISLCLSKLNIARVSTFFIIGLLIAIQSCNFIKNVKSEFHSHCETLKVISYVSNYENPCFISTNCFYFQTAPALLGGTGMRWGGPASQVYREAFNFKTGQIHTVAELHSIIIQRPSFFITNAKTIDDVDKFARETRVKAEKVISGSVTAPVDIYKLSLEEQNPGQLH